MRFGLAAFTFGLLFGCGAEVRVTDDDGTAGSSGDGAAPSNGGSPGNGGESGNGGAPPTETAQYSGEYLPTGALRFAVYKSVPARDVCAVMVVGQLGEQGPFDISVDAAGWLVESVHVLQGAADCGPGSQVAWPPGPGAVTASAAEGGLSLESPMFPCSAAFQVVADFPPDQPWVQPQEDFNGGVDLDVGCD